MKRYCISGLLCGLTLAGLPACSVIRGWFPDKEKDYQYTTEIPDLVLPPDLRNNSFPLPAIAATPDSAATAVEPPADQQTAEAPAAQPATEPAVDSSQNAATSAGSESATGAVEAGSEQLTAEAAPPASERPAAAKPAPLRVERIKSQGQDSLRIHAPFSAAWRAVDKALSRKSIEVNSRDIAEKQFAVRYDPNEMQLQDNSFWDELDFIFFGLQSNEKAYLLKLTDGDQWADLSILDAEGQPASDAGATALLKLLAETIATDFSK